MKRFLGFGICILTMLIAPLSSRAQSQVSDFSGTWTYKSGANPYRISTLVITLTGSELQVTETSQPDKHKNERVLTYYVDGRGESNQTLDGKRELQSRTLWKGDSLLVVFPNVSQSPGQKSERRDQWMLSKDGQTLTINSIMETTRPSLDAARNPLAFPRPPSDQFRRFQFVEKRVFQKQK